MAGNIIGEPIKEIIGEQVDLRQKIQGAGYNESSIQRSPEVLNFLNNKNAWIKLASGVSLDNGDRLKDLAKFESQDYLSDSDIASLLGKNLAKNYILFNTIQSLTQGAELTTTGEGRDAVTTQTRAATYGRRSGVRNTNSWSGNNTKMYGGMGGNGRGLQPVPGIIGINVESINRGSIRKATVTLKAFNKFQFGIIEILYLRLGYLMMLEWGWDKYIDSIDENNNPIIKNVESTIIENNWFKDGSVSQLQMLQNINGFVDRYKGNYQGFFGKVNNFSWTLNEDNTYDITINLITLGSVIESINAIVPSSPLTTSQVAERTKKLRKIYQIKTDDEGNLEEDQEDSKVISNLGSDRISSFVAQQIATFFDQGLGVNKNYYFFPNAVGIRDNDNTEADVNINRSKIPPSSRYYIRFRELLKVIEENVVFKVVNGDSFKESSVTFEKSEKFNRINYEPNLIPLDPSICIFKPVYTEELGITETVGVPSFSGLKDFVVEKENVYYGQLMNIYLNLDYVSQVLNSNKNEKNELNLFDFIQKLLDGINRCMGNVPELTISIKNDRSIYFLDENPITGYEKVYPYKNKEVEFNVIGYTPTNGSTFITDFNFQTKITPKLMTQISIGATAAGSEQNSLNAVGYKNWNLGLTNRFEEKYENGSTFKYIAPTQDEVATEEETYYSDIYEKKFKVEAQWRLVPPSYSWTYKNFTRQYGTENTSFWTSREKNLNDSAMRDLVYDSIEQIDNAIVERGIEIKNEGEKLNDYSTYLLDGFGGTGTKKIEVEVSRREREAKLRENRKARREGTLTGSILEGEGLKTKLVDEEVDTAEALYWYASDNPDFVERGYNTFKRYKSFLDQYQYEVGNVVSGGTGFIPVTLGLTFEGLGGIKIYNQIKVNQKALPASYPSALQFVIDGVNHTVDGNLWKTNITTISRPETTKPVKRKISPSQTVEVKSQPKFVDFTGPEKQKFSLIKKLPLTGSTSNGLIYYPEETNKIQIVLHHTAVNAPIENIVRNWRELSSHVSTHFIINRDGDYDQLFPLKYWGNHIGAKRKGNSYLQKHTISIELEGLGFLKYVNGTGALQGGGFRDTARFKQGSETFTYKDLKQGLDYPAVAKPVVILSSDDSIRSMSSYRGYTYYQAYTPPQLATLKKVLTQIQGEYPNIVIGSTSANSGKQGTKYSDQFPGKGKVSDTAFQNNRGIFTHNSYRTDKRDIFPQKELIELLQEFDK